jgi:hypothetical protein
MSLTDTPGLEPEESALTMLAALWRATTVRGRRGSLGLGMRASARRVSWVAASGWSGMRRSGMRRSCVSAVTAAASRMWAWGGLGMLGWAIRARPASLSMFGWPVLTGPVMLGRPIGRSTSAAILRPLAGASHGCAGWTAVVLRKSRRSIQARRVLVRSLQLTAFDVTIALRDSIRRARPCRKAARTIETHPYTAFDYRRPIDVKVVKTDTHVHHRSVIAEHAPHPYAAQEAYAGVAESVIDAAVKSDVRTPVSGVP